MARCRIVLPKVVGWLLTFTFWVASFSVFRASTIQEAKELFSRVLYGGMGRLNSMFFETIEKSVEISLLHRVDILNITNGFPEVYVLALIVLPLIGCLTMKNTQEKVKEFRFTYAKLFVTVFLLFYGLISLGRVTVFLYANF